MPVKEQSLPEVGPGPIGMFDSGFGGLSVARAVIDLLPGEDLVYFGDTARYPYGPRAIEEVAGFAHEIADHLVSAYGIGLLVVACNTASAAALDSLQSALDIPVIGVLKPGLKAALDVSRSGSVGVIGTVATVSSGAYQQEADLVGANSLVCAACPGFVEFVERGNTDSDQVHVLAERLLAPVIDAGVDTLLLGCTHYPYLARTIGEVMGRAVVLVSSADETAFEVYRVLGDRGESRRGSHTFVSSGDPSWFVALGQRLLGPELSGVEEHIWEDL
jgi:glutamate racemase